MCLDRSLNLLVALLGIQKAGGVYLPLDPGLPAKRIEFMLRDSTAKVLIATDATMSALGRPDGIHVIDIEAESPVLDTLSTESLGPTAGPEDPAYIIYTSGSTGQPKGVTVSHGALANFLGSMQQEPGLSRTDVLVAVTTVSFDIAALELYLPLLVGARIEIASRDVAADGFALAKLLSTSNATVLQATPTTWQQLLEAGWRGSRASAPCAEAKRCRLTSPALSWSASESCGTCMARRKQPSGRRPAKSHAAPDR